MLQLSNLHKSGVFEKTETDVYLETVAELREKIQQLEDAKEALARRVQALQQQLERQDEEWQEQLQTKEEQINQLRHQPQMHFTAVLARAGGNTAVAVRTEG